MPLQFGMGDAPGLPATTPSSVTAKTVAKVGAKKAMGATAAHGMSSSSLPSIGAPETDADAAAAAMDEIDGQGHDIGEHGLAVVRVLHKMPVELREECGGLITSLATRISQLEQQLSKQARFHCKPSL